MGVNTMIKAMEAGEWLYGRQHDDKAMEAGECSMGVNTMIKAMEAGEWLYGRQHDDKGYGGWRMALWASTEQL